MVKANRPQQFPEVDRRCQAQIFQLRSPPQSKKQQRGSKRKESSFRNQAPTKHPPRNIEKRLLSSEKDDLEILGQQTTRIKSNTKKGEGGFRTSRSCEMLPAGLAASGPESPVPQSLHRRPFRLSHLPPPSLLGGLLARARERS